MERILQRKRRGADITGLRSGGLVVLGPTEQMRRGCTLWRCRCDCGNEILLEAYRIQNQSVISCGCARSRKKMKDVAGHRFGRLVAIERLEKKKGSNYLWRCQCDCGKETEVTANALLFGRIKSCGCGRVDAMRNTIKEHGTVADHARLVGGTNIDLLEKKGLRKNNTSGHTGVQKRGSKWIASITFQKKVYYLGIYADIQDAIKARKLAEEKLFGEFLDWYYREHPDKKKED